MPYSVPAAVHHQHADATRPAAEPQLRPVWLEGRVRFRRTSGTILVELGESVVVQQSQLRLQTQTLLQNSVMAAVLLLTRAVSFLLLEVPAK